MKEEKTEVTPNQEIIKYGDLEEKEIDWLWFPYIAKGKITLLQGDPGCGKTFISTSMASIITTGGKFPFTEQNCEIGNVILQNNEDGKEDTLLPRLKLQGADCNRVYCINEEEQYLTVQDYDRIERVFKELRPTLLIIDPIQSFIGDVNINVATEVRTALTPLKNLANKYNCAVIIVMHMKKDTNTKAIYRGMGSVDFLGIARSVLMATKSPDDDNEKLLFHIKGNNAKLGSALIYQVTDKGLEWLNTRDDLEIDSIMNQNFDTKLENAKSFILGCLSKQEMSAKDLSSVGNTTGQFRDKTFNTARANLKTANIITNYQNNNKWYWKLVAPQTPFEENQQPTSQVAGGGEDE